MPIAAFIQHERWFRALVEHSTDAIILTASDGTITYASPSTDRVTGYAAEELVGMNSFALVHPDDLEQAHQRIIDLLEYAEGFVTVEYRLRHKDGTWHWIEGTVTNLLFDPAVRAFMFNFRDITERKRAKERYRTLFERASDGIFVTDLQGRFVEVNPAGCTLSGYNRDELLTRSIEDLVSGEDRTAVRAGVERLHAGETFRTRWRIQCKNGSLLPIELSMTPLSTGRLLGIVRDISARIQAEEARQQLLAREQVARVEAEAAQARLYELFMQAPASMAVLRGPEHRFEFVNRLSLSNRDRADPVGKTVREIFPEFVEQGILAVLDEVYTTGTPFIGTEVPIWIDRRGDGVLEEAYYNLVYQPSRTLQGDIEGIWVYTVEVTEQVQARRRVEELNRQLEAERDALRQATQEAEAQASELTAVFEAMTEGVYVCDARGEIHYTNPAFRSLLALEEDADPSVLLLDNRFKWLAKRDLEGRPLPKEQEPVLRVLRGERLSGTHRMDVLCRTRKGEDLILNVSGAPIRDATGQIVGGVVVFHDVTGRRRLEQQLQYSERKLRSLVESNIFGVVVSDTAGRIYEANDRFAQMVGYSKEELLSGAFTGWQLNLPEYTRGVSAGHQGRSLYRSHSPLREGIPAQRWQSRARPGGGSHD